MTDWRPDSADVDSDQDTMHEPLLMVDLSAEPAPAPPAPVVDIAVASVTAPASAVQGEALDIAVVLANLGDAEAICVDLRVVGSSAPVEHYGGPDRRPRVERVRYSDFEIMLHAELRPGETELFYLRDYRP